MKVLQNLLKALYVLLKGLQNTMLFCILAFVICENVCSLPAVYVCVCLYIFPKSLENHSCFITNQLLYEDLYFRSLNVVVIQLPSFSRKPTGIESSGFSVAGAALGTYEMYHSKGHKQRFNIFWQSCLNPQGAFEITGYC